MKPSPVVRTIDLGDGRKVSIETGLLAKQADGSVIVRMGDTMLLATVVSAREAKEDVDFMPLTVDYQEKFASTGTASDHGNLSGLQDQDHLRHPYWVTADQYGIPKDGVIDAAGPLNTVITAIGATDTIFYFGPGTYLLSSADVAFPNNITLYLAPGAIFSDGGGTRGLVIQSQPIASSTYHFAWTGTSSVLFFNFYIGIDGIVAIHNFFFNHRI
jgi:hypothetical protein